MKMDTHFEMKVYMLPQRCLVLLQILYSLYPQAANRCNIPLCQAQYVVVTQISIVF